MLHPRRIKHKGLRLLYEDGDESRLNAQSVDRLKRMLAALNIITAPQEMDLPGYGFHELKANRRGTYALTVRSDGIPMARSMSIWRTTMAAERGLPKFKPPHPGAYLRLDILPALGMTITELAEHLQISRASLSELVNERRSVSVEMAQRLGQAFGNGTRFWMTLQMQYDIWQAERDSDIVVKRVKPSKVA